MSNKGVIIAGHGSRHPEGLEVINQTAARYQSMHPEWVVRPAFMELAEPSLEMVAEQMANEGINDITCVPLFLAFGHHMAKDLPERAKTIEENHPKITLTLTKHIGADPLLCNIIENRIME